MAFTGRLGLLMFIVMLLESGSHTLGDHMVAVTTIRSVDRMQFHESDLDRMLQVAYNL